ncbi:MAG: hypothetical protein GF418_01095 [Chitinivibrionales bacterium]|nr:hypothetical protein [Chitinivibrionales bacterium]MBD3394198.1 hypothetical protein [Chitinivibrionales bacterium]
MPDVFSHSGTTMRRFCGMRRNASLPAAVLSALLMGLASRCILENPTKPPFPNPRIVAMSDTVVSVHDTITLHAARCKGSDSIYAYIWSLDGGATAFPASDSAIPAWWMPADTGENTVLVRGLGVNGSESDPDTIIVTVRLNAPSVKIITGDTTIHAHDTLVIRASARDSNGTVIECLWSSDIAGADTARADSFVMVPSLADTGIRTVTVRSRDDDSLVSAADSVRITVFAGHPWIAPVNDTAVSAQDTLRVCISAGDSNGAIQHYLWDLDGGGWDDTLAAPCRSIPYGGADSLRVTVAAVDADGFTAPAEFIVTFNLAPAIPSVSAPPDTVLFRLRDSTFIRGELDFAFASTDPDGPDDSLYYSLYLGPGPGSLSRMYAGHDTTYALSSIDTGLYYWRLTARDIYGNTSLREDSMRCMLEHDVCFIGHSIVKGLGGASGHGGFRQNVLEGLRDDPGRFRAFNAAGPLVTGSMDNADDDSCLAVSGATSWEILDTLALHPETESDIWVLMVGVNGDMYGYWERYYSRKLIDSVLVRNTDAFLYILGGLPLPDTVASYRHTRLYSFNDMLDSLAGARRDEGYNTRYVDAFSAVAPDSTFDSTLFVDMLHPNQDGYDRIAEEILRVMRDDF